MSMLAMHQMRVAAVAFMICESLNIEIDKESVLKACLLHDMGNIIKFNLANSTEWNKPEGTEYWQKVKDKYVSKYGSNEHNASLAIVLEIGMTIRIHDLVDCIDSSIAEKIVKEDDFEKKICAYVDNRVSPFGVVSAEEHSLNAKERYKDHPHAFSEESRVSFMKNLYLIENQIFSYSNIKPSDINDESIKNYLEKLQDFSI